MDALKGQFTIPETSQDYLFRGTGNPNECKRLVEEVLDISYCIDQGFCAGDTETYSVPPVEGHYLVDITVTYTCTFYYELQHYKHV